MKRQSDKSGTSKAWRTLDAMAKKARQNGVSLEGFYDSLPKEKITIEVAVIDGVNIPPQIVAEIYQNQNHLFT